MNINIEIGSLWVHNGNFRNMYEIICIANESSTNPEYPVTIVYKGKNGKIWCKDLNNFLARMVYEGKPETQE